MDLNNLLIWFSFGPDGKIDQIVNLSAVHESLDLEEYFKQYAAPNDYKKAGVYTFTKEYIETPKHIMGGVEGTAFIMHYHGQRHRAILPWFVTIGR